MHKRLRFALLPVIVAGTLLSSLAAHAQTLALREFLPGVDANGTREAMEMRRCATLRSSTDDRIAACKEYLASGHPHRLGVLYALADAYRRAGDYPHALAAIDQALSELTDADRSQRIFFTTERAVTNVERGNRQDVEPTIQQISAIAPDTEALYVDRCWLRAVAGAGLDQAVEDCNKALAMDAEDFGTMDSRAMAQLKLGKWDACIADTGVALGLNSDLSSALYMRGYCEDHMGDHAGAARDVASAKMLDPGVADLLAKQGVPAPQD